MTTRKQIAEPGEYFVLNKDPDLTTVLKLPLGVSRELEIRTREGVVISLTLAPGSCVAVRNPPEGAALTEATSITFGGATSSHEHSIH